jgi:hypothetical protein
MSIIADIRQSKAEFEDHVATHGCRPTSAAIADGEVPCTVRVELWTAYVGSSVSAAGMWGKEHDDDARQRDHFNRNLRPAAAL